MKNNGDISRQMRERILLLDGAMGTMLQRRGLSGNFDHLNLTAPETVAEVHRAYIDIQAPISGMEAFGIDYPPPEVFAGFNEEKDYVLFKARGQARVCEPGDFAIFFPEEGAHAPCRSVCGPYTVRKLVIKVRY